METSSFEKLGTTRPAVRAALSSLVDYAGLFPPAQLAMGPAVTEYASSRRGPFAWMLGRFIVPASRIGELASFLPPEEPPFSLSVICDTGWDARHLAALREDSSRLRIDALEIPAAPNAIEQTAASLRANGLADLPAYIEWPREADWTRELPVVMRRLSEHRFGAKIRCGGVVDSAFPSPDEIAAFIAAATAHDIPYKATAGLHHPIRHLNVQSGFVMHGFLNVLFAAVFAREGLPQDEVSECLACEDPRQFHLEAHELHWNGRTARAQAIDAARRKGFVSYGSCSFAEPTEDLQTLGIL